MDGAWRIEYKGGLYHHGLSRGNERKDIFRDDRDRLNLILWLLVVGIIFVLLVGCQHQDGNEYENHTTNDPHSFARPDEVAVTHLDLDVEVDFESKRISGRARLYLENKTGANDLYLDSNNLTIEEVTLDEDEEKTTFTLSAPVEFLGEALIVKIKPQTQFVTVYYSTGPQATALLWLEPQTIGDKHPFLSTQSETIHARSWIPIQDSPGIRMTYNARVKVPEELMAVMSAENPTSLNPNGIYEFKMPQPIPAYLLALAVGDIEFQAMSERSGVYARPEEIEKATWDLADTEKIMVAAEEVYGPYRWGRYDILVLPPSFPYGGMENPRLAFISQSLLTGDRQFASIVASHELAHSWSGNLVTAATWNDFWLNEGFTTYCQHRIIEKLYGTDYSNMLSVLELDKLKQTIKEMGPESKDTHLYVNLTGHNPDNAITPIPYYKGYFFLRLLEETVGRQRFDAFLHYYFSQYEFKSMTTVKFVTLLHDVLFQGNSGLEQEVHIDSWIYGPGLPANAPKVQSALLERVDIQIQAFLNGTPAQDLQTNGWGTLRWKYFLSNLSETLSYNQMAELDAAFNFTQSSNSQILFEWLLLAIDNNYEPAYSALKDYLASQGGLNSLKRLYTQMAKTPEGKEMALEIYKEVRPMYPPVTREAIDKILELD